MDQVARSVGAQIGSIIGILWLVWTVWITYHYSNDELELRGSVSYLQVAFAHIIIYRILVELCQRETYCAGDTNFFRWWGMLILIHYSTAWVLFLRTRRRTGAVCGWDVDTALIG
jgi:hypothetical protein